MPQDFDIKEELHKLPNKPGVYIMHDKDDTILYVGCITVCVPISRKISAGGRRLTKWCLSLPGLNIL